MTGKREWGKKKKEKKRKEMSKWKKDGEMGDGWRSERVKDERTVVGEKM